MFLATCESYGGEATGTGVTLSKAYDSLIADCETRGMEFLPAFTSVKFFSLTPLSVDIISVNVDGSQMV
jgi:hypothetical protein